MTTYKTLRTHMRKAVTISYSLIKQKLQLENIHKGSITIEDKDWFGSPTALGGYREGNRIYLYMEGFRNLIDKRKPDTVDLSAFIELSTVYILAHEMRHWWQKEKLPDSLLKIIDENDKDKSYGDTWIEKDANEYADNFMRSYIGWWDHPGVKAEDVIKWIELE